MITWKPCSTSATWTRRASTGNPLVRKVKGRAHAAPNAGVVVLCAKVEAEISELDEDDRSGFLADLG
jgi:ribosome-binding ATPase YchF (GTP1/OBG family)